MYTNLPAGVTQKRANVNGIHINYLEAVPSNGKRTAATPGTDPPFIVLIHGWPETSYSWRHQMKPLADAGWHVIAPDQRGYGGSTCPRVPEAYSTDRLSQDVLSLVDHVSDRYLAKAVFVGHDWGALLLWDLCRMHPERVRAAVAVSVPLHAPPMPPIEMFKKIHGDKFFYILHFQQLGQAESDLDKDPKLSLRRIYWTASGDYDNPLGLATELPEVGTRILDTFAEPPNLKLPPWCSEADLDNYAEAFKTSGFFGGVSWYRNFDANWHRLQAFPVSNLTMPVYFIGGKKDPVIRDITNLIDKAHAPKIPGYKGSKLIDNSGHWTQQETPQEFNKALLGFLETLEFAPGNNKSSSKM